MSRHTAQEHDDANAALRIRAERAEQQRDALLRDWALTLNRHEHKRCGCLAMHQAAIAAVANEPPQETRSRRGGTMNQLDQIKRLLFDLERVKRELHILTAAHGQALEKLERVKAQRDEFWKALEETTACYHESVAQRDALLAACKEMNAATLAGGPYDIDLASVSIRKAIAAAEQKGITNETK